MKKLRNNIHFFLKDNGVVHMYDELSKEHYKIGIEQKKWLEEIDGTKSDAELKKIIPEQYFEEFMSYINSFNLLEETSTKAKKNINPFKIKISLINNDIFFEKIKKVCILYRKTLFIATPILLLLAFIIFIFQNINTDFDFTNMINNIEVHNIFFYIVIIFLTGTLHELSHTFVAKSYSVSIPSIGIMLFYFMPSFFVDISGINFINEKEKRVKILLSGILMNMNVATICLIFMMLFNINSNYIIFTIVLNFMMIIVNMIPYIEFDGYYILINLIENSTIKYSLLKKNKSEPYEIIFSIISLFFVSSIIFSTVNNLIRLIDLPSFLTYIIYLFLFITYIFFTRKGVTKG